MGDRPPRSVRVTVTFVHGTYARWASWACASSPLGRALVRQFRRHIVIERHLWSSSNSVRARAKAAQTLQERLRRLIREYPDAHHFLVGHSHGGTVAWYALLDEELRQRIAGVVTLSTPFLHAQPRRRPAPLIGMSPLVFWLLLPTVAFMALMFNASLLLTASEPVNPAGWSLLGVVTVAIDCMLLGLGLRYLIIPRLVKSQSRLLRRFVCPPLDPSRALIIRVAGDEASALLGGAAFASWLMTKVDATCARVMFLIQTVLTHRRTYKVLGLVSLVSAILLIGSMVVGALGRPLPDVPTLWLTVVTGLLSPLLFALCLPFLLLAVFLVDAAVSVLLLVAAVLSLPLSGDLWLLPLVVAITPEATPTGIYTVHQYDPRSADDGPVPAGLLHSVAYNDPRVIALLLAWMDERVRSSPHLMPRAPDPVTS